MGSTTAVPGKPAKKKKTRVLDETPGAEAQWLRERTDRRREWRFPPKSNLPSILGVIVSSGGAVLAGAGVYSVIRKMAHSYGPALLLGGIALFLIGLWVSSRAVVPVRVGDAGVAVEGRAGLDRVAWFEIEGVTLANGLLTFRGEGKVIHIPVADHPAAYAMALTEARSRIPTKAKRVPGEVAPPRAGEGESLVLPPPQLAGLHCKASDEIIAFENDARLCGRCGETYHRTTVPPRCLTCDARLV